jgi:hypothetical protein
MEETQFAMVVWMVVAGAFSWMTKKPAFLFGASVGVGVLILLGL